MPKSALRCIGWHPDSVIRNVNSVGIIWYASGRRGMQGLSKAL